MILASIPRRASRPLRRSSSPSSLSCASRFQSTQGLSGSSQNLFQNALSGVNLSLLPSINRARAYVGLLLTRRQPAAMLFNRKRSEFVYKEQRLSVSGVNA
jgi:hypothetical protein